RGAQRPATATAPAKTGLAADPIGPPKADKKIKDIYNRLKTGGFDFATLASQRSEDAGTNLRGGKLGFATEQQLRQQIFATRPDIVDQLMKMSAGQITEPIMDKVSNRWYIIKVDTKVEQARNLTLEDVRANITNAITQQRQGILLNALV